MSLNCEPFCVPTPGAGRQVDGELIDLVGRRLHLIGELLGRTAETAARADDPEAQRRRLVAGADAHADHRAGPARHVGVGDDLAGRAVLRRPPHAGRLVGGDELDLPLVEADARPRRCIGCRPGQDEIRRRLQRAAVGGEHRLRPGLPSGEPEQEEVRRRHHGGGENGGRMGWANAHGERPCPGTRDPRSPRARATGITAAFLISFQGRRENCPLSRQFNESFYEQRRIVERLTAPARFLPDEKQRVCNLRNRAKTRPLLARTVVDCNSMLLMARIRRRGARRFSMSTLIFLE